MALPSFGRLSNRIASKGASQRRRQNDTVQDIDTDADDPELTSYLAALAPEPDQDSDLESTGSGRRFGDGLVYQVRLNHIASQQLKDLAVERDTSPQALAQEWVLERLGWESQITPGYQHIDNQSDGPDTEQLFLGQQWS